MKEIVFRLTLCTMLLALCSFAEAQQQSKIARVGILFMGGKDQPHLEALKKGLSELGYTEGKNIILEYRYAEGRYDRLPELANELANHDIRQCAGRTQGNKDDSDCHDQRKSGGARTRR